MVKIVDFKSLALTTLSLSPTLGVKFFHVWKVSNWQMEGQWSEGMLLGGASIRGRSPPIRTEESEYDPICLCGSKSKITNKVIL